MYETMPIAYRGRPVGGFNVARGRTSGMSGFGKKDMAISSGYRGAVVSRSVVVPTMFGPTVMAPAAGGGFQFQNEPPQHLKQQALFQRLKPKAPKYDAGVGDFLTTEGDSIENASMESGMFMEMVPVEMSTSEEDSGLGGIFDGILEALGLRDPLTHYEPELMAQGKVANIFSKYSGLIDRYAVEVGGLRSNSARSKLSGEIDRLARMRDDLLPAFAPGVVVVGAREKEKLGDLVQGVRNWQTDWRNAQKEFGVGPISPMEAAAGLPAPSPSPAPSPQSPLLMFAPSETPWGMIALVGLGALLLGNVMSKRGRRRT